MEKVNITEKFRAFDKYWQSKMVSEFNSRPVKLAKLKGEFDWHLHRTEDEFYLVLKGSLLIQLREREIVLNEGDLFVVPANTEHRIVARDETHMMIIDPKSTSNSDSLPDPQPIEKNDELPRPGTKPAGTQT